MITSLIMSSCLAASSCPDGYRKDETGHCQDINECLEGGRKQCGQLCTNTLGAFQCSCLGGYTLEADRWSCFVQEPTPSIMFSHGMDISQMDEGGTNLLPILQNVGTVHSFDYNIMHERIYFIDSTRNLIGWAPLTGGADQILISSGVGILESVAVDWINLRIYWSDSLFKRVESCSIYGTDRRIILETGPRTPTAIVLDPMEGYIFISTIGRRQRIQRGTLDGTRQKTIIKSGVSNIKSFVLDYVDKRLFWLDNGTGMIESSYYDGSERETVTAGLNSDCYGLSLFVDHIYWTRLTDQTISRANKYTGHDMVVITTTYLDSNPRSIHVVHPFKQPPQSPTARVNCTTHDDCPIDIGEGQPPPAPQPFLVFTNRHDIQRINFDGTDYMQVAFGNMENLVDLDYDPADKMVYFADAGKKTIEHVGMDGQNRGVVCEGLGTVNGIALDWLRGRLYWTDSEEGHIASCSIHACIPEVIVDTGLQIPSGIAVHPSLNLIYWTDVGNPAKIEAIRHDGRHRATIATSNLTMPTGITIDYKNQKLLWIDSARKVIEISNLDGTERSIITGNQLGQPFGISEFQDYVWFTEWEEDMIVRVDKSTGGGRVRLRGSMQRPTGVQVVHPSRRVISSINPCSVFNGGCEQICIQAHINQVVCACNNGHRLRNDGATCNLDECYTGKHNCSVNAFCEDTDPSFYCRCKPGFNGNGYTCIAPTTPRSELIAPPQITYPLPTTTTKSSTTSQSFTMMASNTRHWHHPSLTTARSTTASRSTLPPDQHIPVSSHHSLTQSSSSGRDETVEGAATVTSYPDDVIGGQRTTPDMSHFGQCGPEYRYYCVNGGVCRWLINIKKPSCSCLSGYAGERCLLVKPIIPASGMSGAMVAAVSVGILVPIFLIIVGIACLIHRKRSKIPNATLHTEIINMQSQDRLNYQQGLDRPQNNSTATDCRTTPPSPVATTKLISSSERLTIPSASATLPLYQSCKRKAPTYPAETERYMEPAHIPTLRRVGTSGYQTPRKGAPVIMPKPTFKLAGGVAAHALLHRKLSIEQEQLQMGQDFVDIDGDSKAIPTVLTLTAPNTDEYDRVVGTRRAWPDNFYMNTPKLIPKNSK
ncbi:low-density lipoprotein receptor-related protein 4-like [Patiria miniata]|uniref:EGF-like domain-containing protein n=1 Tax=Patiria miniata TaxID=46514 RepID=A0A914A9P0_PATMI|nr:low-density lipoprotein receptor-related protein 4-like [Patiria miniata]